MMKAFMDLRDAAVRLTGALSCIVGISLGLAQDALRAQAGDTGPGLLEWLCMIGAVTGLFVGATLTCCGGRLLKAGQDGVSPSRSRVNRRR